MTAMKNSISEVLETMFFLPLDFSDAVNPGELWGTGRETIVVSRLSFSGPLAGRFVFFVPQELALSLTAGFLGKDKEGISQDNVAETVKEIINMIAGNTFSCYDNQAVFNLDIPKLISFDEAMEDDPNLEEEIFISIETLEDQLAVKMVYRISNGVS